MNSVSHHPCITLEVQKQPILEEQLIQEQPLENSVKISGRDALIVTRIVVTNENRLHLYGKSYVAEGTRARFIPFGGGQEWCFQVDNETSGDIAVAYLDAQEEAIQTEFFVGEEEKLAPAQKKIFEPPDETKSIRISLVKISKVTPD